MATSSKKGLTSKYNEDEYFRLTVKKLIVLAFVSLDRVIIGFDLICDQLDDASEDLRGYFEKMWIGEPKRRERSPNLIINYGMFMIVPSLQYLDPTIRSKAGTMHSLIASQLIIQIS
ncbi:unnamed protein product [Rotaria socialis]